MKISTWILIKLDKLFNFCCCHKEDENITRYEDIVALHDKLNSPYANKNDVYREYKIRNNNGRTNK